MNSLIIVLLQVAIIWPFLVANKMKTAYTQISCPKFEPPTECSLTVTESSKKERRKNKGRCCRGKCKRKKPTSDKSKDTVIVIDNISCERKNRSECSTDTSLVAGQDDYIVSTKICFPLPMGTQWLQLIKLYCRILKRMKVKVRKHLGRVQRQEEIFSEESFLKVNLVRNLR